MIERWGSLRGPPGHWRCCWPGWPSSWPPAAYGVGVFDSLSQGGFDDPDTESARELVLERDTFGNQGVDVVAIYSSDELAADDPEFQRRGRATPRRHPPTAPPRR